jgi:maleylpyruvate isomerase
MDESGRERSSEVGLCVEGAILAHQLLLQDVHRLTDEDVRRPSLLPDWSIAHVLAHLARNADSHTRMLRAAAGGEIADQYVGGVAGRAADIEQWAGRSAGDIAADLGRAVDELERCWATAANGAWQGHGRLTTGQVTPTDDLPFRRWREVVVHHHDLGLDYSWADWPAGYVRVELRRSTMQWASRKPMGFADLPPAALAVTDHHRVAWLLGRAEISGLDPAGLMA